MERNDGKNELGSATSVARFRFVASTARRLVLGMTLIIAASAILLLSDQTGNVSDLPVVALLQHASQPIIDEGAYGVIAGLAEGGFVDGKTMILQRYNAEGDAATSNTIAREMVGGRAQLLITLSTPSLQAVANANRSSQKNHVFALVTDPAATGVGISPTDPLDHPAWIAGYGTLQPVREAFFMAKEMFPKLKKIGVIFNAAEVNSEAQLKLARKTSAELGVQLMELAVENSSGVGEATGALTARGVDCIFLLGDVTVLVAAETLIATAAKSGIPVFSVIPPNVKRGAIFDLGANYSQVGHKAGLLAAEILSGRNPATVEIVNFVPHFLAVNQQAVMRYPKWKIPPGLVERANLIIRSDGTSFTSQAQPQVP